MATTVTFGGVNYKVPAYNDVGWAQGVGNLSSYLVALAAGTIQTTGGTFTLTAPLNFGVTYGITAASFTGPLTGNVTGNVTGSSGSCTGNAATVTTNANLTGPITSVGNATTIAGPLPAISGANLTHITAANIDAGTITATLSGSAAAVGGITVTGTPAAGQLLVASSTSAASWQEYRDIIDSVGNSGSTKTIDWSLGLVAKVTLTAGCTFTWSNAIAGQTLTLFLTQGGSGSYGVTWPTTKWPSATAPTLTTTIGATDVFAIFYDGANYYGFTGGLAY